MLWKHILAWKPATHEECSISLLLDPAGQQANLHGVKKMRAVRQGKRNCDPAADGPTYGGPGHRDQAFLFCGRGLSRTYLDAGPIRVWT